MPSKSDQLPANVPFGLVGDIGGTNCRLALATADAQGVHLFAPRAMKNADYPTPEACIRHYFAEVGIAAPAASVLDVAGPVNDGRAHLTNAQWQLDERALQAALGIRTVRLI